MLADNIIFNDNLTSSDRVLHTPGRFARNNLLYVQEVGFLKSIQPHKCSREMLDSFLIMVVMEGAGKVTVKGTEYSLNKGDLAFIDCFQPYEHVSSECDPWELGWLHFNGVQARGYYDLFIQCNGGQSVIHSVNASKYNEIIKRIYDLQNLPILKSERKSAEEILELLNNVIDEFENTEALEKHQERELVDQLRDYLSINFSNKDIQDILKEEYSNLACLEKAFANLYGISINDYILSRRMNRAKELLRFTIKHSDEIAAECGYANLQEMEAHFSEYEHMSTAEYRGKWAGWIRN